LVIKSASGWKTYQTASYLLSTSRW